jgi:replicative DNA helicase
MAGKKIKQNVAAAIAESLGDGSFRTKNLDVERQVLYHCFRKPINLQVITANLTVDDFSDVRHKVFYKYIASSNEQGRYPDPSIALAVAKRSVEFEVDPEDYEAGMRDVLGSGEDIDVEAACHLLHDLYIVRKILGFARRIDANITEGADTAELIGHAEEFIRGVATDSIKANTLKTIDDIVESNPNGVRDFIETKRDGILTPFTTLNEFVYGFEPGKLVIIGARPSVGKSALLCQIAFEAANNGRSVLFYSHEMYAQDMWTRIFCQQVGIMGGDFLHNSLTQQEKESVIEFVKHSAPRNLRISDTGGKTPLALRAELARFKAKHGNPDMVVIDYLQRMKCPNKSGNRFQEVSEISRSLKDIAMEFNTRMIVAAQVSRAAENRPGGDNRPQMSDLRESGDIEADADLIIFPHRPSLYWKKAGQPPPHDELIVAKNRQGKTGIIPVDFKGAYYKFLEKV